MIITANISDIENDEKDEIIFESESIVDGMKIGVLKEKLAQKGIPVKMQFNPKDNSIVNLIMTQKDLLDLLC